MNEWNGRQALDWPPGFSFQRLSLPTLLIAVLSTALVSNAAIAEVVLTPLHDMVLDPNALVLADGGTFNRTINGRPHQQDVIISHGGFQYAAWYSNGGSDEDLFLARRSLDGTTWETVDTGYGMINGDGNPNHSPSRRWDSHNSISMGISGDGRIHMAFDHHVDELRYLATDPGAATINFRQWNASIFDSERDELNLNGARIPRVTYPRFTNVGDDIAFTYRDRSSSDGDHYIANYDSQTGQWTDPLQFTDGRAGTYVDIDGMPSDRRNAYLNGVHVDPQGTMHFTWTWRESSGIGNHDISYAYSEDRGTTWKNNAGHIVGSPGSPISIESPGIEVVDVNYQQALINQQGGAVDNDGGVHALMFHRRQEPGFEWQPGDATFHRTDSAYHHYYRDPTTGEWDVNQIPLEDGERVGSRPSLGADADGNLFALYTQSNDLVIAGATKTARGYKNWQVLYRDQRNFEGTPRLDRQRLLDEGVLSVYVQERPTVSFEDAATGSPLRVLDFAISDFVPRTYYLQASHPVGNDLDDVDRWFDAADPDIGESLLD